MKKILLVIFMLFVSIQTTQAFDFSSVKEGEYKLSASLSCYVHAMGGIEFGANLLESAHLKVAGNGDKSIVLNLGKSSVTIYNIECDVFVDASPNTQGTTNPSAGTIGLYQNGSLITSGIRYTLSSDTALNAAGESVKYVKQIVIPISSQSNTYDLTLYINSNVMGVQFGAIDNDYKGTLTIDWSKISALNSTTQSGMISTQQNTSNQSTDQSVEDLNEEADVQEESGLIERDENDGLNVYFADSADEDQQMTVYINQNTLLIMTVISGLFIFIGVLCLLVPMVINRKETKNEKD